MPEDSGEPPAPPLQGEPYGCGRIHGSMKPVLIALVLLASTMTLLPQAEATHPCFGPDCGIPHPCEPPNPDLRPAYFLKWFVGWLTCRS